MNPGMRDCTYCGNEVPAGAARCKHCFGDLSGDAAPKRGTPMLALLVLGLIFVAGGGAVALSRKTEVFLGHVSVDPREERLILLYVQEGAPVTTRQLFWNDIASFEVLVQDRSLGAPHFQAFAVLTGGEKVELDDSEQDLQPFAYQIAKQVGDKSVTFNDQRKHKL